MAVTMANVTLKLACDARPAFKEFSAVLLAIRMLQLETFWARTYEVWAPRDEGGGL